MERLVGVSIVARVSGEVAGVLGVAGRFGGWGSGFWVLLDWIGSGAGCCVVVGSNSVGADGKAKVGVSMLLLS